MKKTVISAGLGIFAAALLLSCASTKQAAVETVNPLLTDWIEVEMTEPEEAGYFYTVGDFLPSAVTQMSVLEVEFKKSSGYAKAAYGFVFGYTEPTKTGKLDSYLRFEINTDGEYALYRVEGSNYTDLVEENSSNTAYFQESSLINKGYDTVNKMRLDLTSANTYNLSLNGQRIASNIQPVTGGTNGAQIFFSVGKAGQEKLPDETVKLAYRITDAKIKNSFRSSDYEK